MRQVLFLVLASAKAGFLSSASLHDSSLLTERAEGVDEIELKVGDQSTGLQMPLLGFGTCCRASARGPELKKSIAAYLDLGGKLIDTAIMYENHKDIGEALSVAFRNNVITREQLWVTSKIAPNHASTKDEALQRVNEILRDLQLEYVDLLLIHAPSDHSVELWQGLVTAKEKGQVKAIGVSNFNEAQIQALESQGLQRPSVNQIQFHPWVGQRVFDSVAWCQSHGVAITAYGSLGSGYHHGLNSDRVKQVAEKHNDTPAQVLLAWALAQKVAVVPGATSKEHIAEDLNAGDLELDGQEIRYLIS